MTTSLFRRRLGSVAGIALLLAACGTDPGDGGSNPGGNPAIALALSVTSLSIEQGQSGSLTATITRSGGFSGAVNVTTEGAPQGVTAGTTNVSTSGGTTTGTVTITVGAAVTPGTYNLTIRASGSGVSDQTQGFTLTVTAPPAAPSIALSATPAAVSVIQGASGTSTIAIARTNFTGAVSLTLEGVPTGVTGTFNPASVTGTTSTLTLQVGAAVAPGVYDLVIRGAGTGITAATTALQLTVTTPPAYTIASIAPDPVTIAQSAQGTVTVTLTRSNFAGAVTLALEGAPAGVSGTFDPAAPTGTTSTLTIQVTSAAPAGSHTLTVRGTATGLADRTKTFVLAVTPGVTGSYTLSTTPATQTTLQQGASGTVTVNINRTGGFTGTVALSVSGAPAGLTASLSPTSTAGNTSTLSLQVSAGLTPGNYPLVITGLSTGLPNQTVNVTVNVTAAPAGGNVTLDFSGCSIDTRPIWLAFQNGTSGPWIQVNPSGTSFSFTVDQGKGGVAWVTQGGVNAFGVTVQYYSQAELQAFNVARICDSGVATKSLTATISGLTAGQQANVSLGGGSGSAFANGTVTINEVKNGTYDLFAYARSLLAPGAGDRLVISRGINTAGLTPGASVGTINFGAGLTPATGTITVANLIGGDAITHGMLYNSGVSCEVASLYFGATAASSPFTAYGVPGANMLGGETHGLFVSATNGSTAFRTVIDYFTALGNRTVTLPAPLNAFSPTVVAGPYKRLRFQTTYPVGLNASTTVGYADAGSTRVVTISASLAGYVGGSTIDLSMPDLSGVAGWQNGWAPASGATVNWTATAAGATILDACTPGSISSSSRLGTA